MTSRGLGNSLPDPSTTYFGVPTRNTNLGLEPGAVYVAVFSMATRKNYHWALVIATRERSWNFYHNTNQGGNFTSMHSTIHICSTLNHFWPLSKETPTTGLTCRTWLLDALYEMVDWGLLGLHPNRARIDQIEAEVLGRAMNVSGAIERDEEGTVTVSQYFEG
ncbi:hypothetical protein TEQG_08621 [Trichophyton equinum CBS 127.97]|uniref:Uncharacterized protein n=1 Tax=Trichophyton equinum (strain ATCC MYA-4606 / CBS 127.97) TaxID=559882 RepID=F2PM75_TRIEC|nr:hypothetical protein TEQG_08621 [Trichophyton equinum CBS 127.97]